jgi:hypothetical protein
MGRKAELSVQEQWRAAGKQPRIQNAVECRYCGHFESKNTSRQAIHLADCKPYLRYKLNGIDKRASKHPETSGHSIVLAERLTTKTKNRFDNLARVSRIDNTP